MKKCPYCGLENPDEAIQCVTCHTDLVTPTSSAIPQPEARPVTPLDEQRFWERMTFRQFAALFLRLQSIWLLWYAVLDLTYIPAYVGRSYSGGIYLSPGAFRLILRIILHVAAAIAVIQYADRILSWLVRDWIRNQPPPDKSLQPTAAAPSAPDEPGNPKAGSASTSPSSRGG
jgi:hypothetical protein